MKENYAQVNGINICYEVKGDGSPIILKEITPKKPFGTILFSYIIVVFEEKFKKILRKR